MTGQPTLDIEIRPHQPSRVSEARRQFVTRCAEAAFARDPSVGAQWHVAKANELADELERAGACSWLRPSPYLVADFMGRDLAEWGNVEALIMERAGNTLPLDVALKKLLGVA